MFTKKPPTNRRQSPVKKTVSFGLTTNVEDSKIRKQNAIKEIVELKKEVRILS